MRNCGRSRGGVVDVNWAMDLIGSLVLGLARCQPSDVFAFSRLEYQVFYSQVIGGLEWVPHWKN